MSRRVDAAIDTAVCVASERAKLSSRPFARARSIETIRDWRRDSEVSKASEQIKIEKNRGVGTCDSSCATERKHVDRSDGGDRRAGGQG